jgi:hypothetical protein
MSNIFQKRRKFKISTKKKQETFRGKPTKTHKNRNEKRKANADSQAHSLPCRIWQILYATLVGMDRVPHTPTRVWARPVKHCQGGRRWSGR